MQNSNTIIIPISKFKTLIAFIGSLSFVAIGIVLLNLDSEFISSQRRFNGPFYIYGIALVDIVFFAIIGLLTFNKLFQTKPGLTLSKQGIIDHSSGVSAGIILWSEITQISEYTINRQSFVSIKVLNPEPFLNQGNFIRKMAIKANMNMTGAPINISSNSLKIKHQDLKKIILDSYQKFK